ncbi:MAG: hypothetical protein Q8Q09_24350 [Deltaproteobacteria bacterium]|nr:hypothetical protein [Deltaproteobacteria bacterium]
MSCPPVRTLSLCWLFSATLWAACRTPSPQDTTRPPDRVSLDASESAEAGPPQAVQPPRAVDLELVGSPEVSGALSPDAALRSARMLTPYLRACALTVPERSEFVLRVMVDATGAHASAQAQTHGITREGLVACLEDAARRGAVSPVPSPSDDAGFSARYRVFVPSNGRPRDPSRRCERDDECRFVTGSCEYPAPVHRLHAESIARAMRARMSRVRCASPQGVPARARCLNDECSAEPLDHPTWSACERDDQCVAVAQPNQSVRAIARNFTREMLASDPTAHLAQPHENTAPLRCHYGFCMTQWGEP